MDTFFGEIHRKNQRLLNVSFFSGIGIISTKGGEVIFIHCSTNHGCVAEDKLSGRWKQKFVKGKRLFETIEDSSSSVEAASNEESLEGESLDAAFQKAIAAMQAATGCIDKTTPGKYPEASERYLTYTDLVRLTGLDKWELGIMRNEIFARHGYEFNINRRVIEYFQKQDWYVKIPKISKSGAFIYNFYLSDIEKHNIEVIKRYE
jgi:hypothetical protein